MRAIARASIAVLFGYLVVVFLWWATLTLNAAKPMSCVAGHWVLRPSMLRPDRNVWRYRWICDRWEAVDE